MARTAGKTVLVAVLAFIARSSSGPRNGLYKMRRNYTPRPGGVKAKRPDQVSPIKCEGTEEGRADVENSVAKVWPTPVAVSRTIERTM